jgi:excisionase family DNA binding protein
VSVPTVAGWLTVPQAAEASQLSEWTLRREINAGRLVACRIGRCIRIRPADLEAWQESRRVEQAS